MNKCEALLLAHGGGGELTKKLLEKHILPKLSNELLDPLMDSAVFNVNSERICMTTDSFVVQPLEFPGGNIGRLAVCGTVNDICMMGAAPRILSLSLILEEGLPLSTLDRIMDSIADAAAEAGVPIGTGDTKVVESKGQPGMMITTSGIGELFDNVTIDAKRIQPDDAILITGRIAEHGLAVMSARKGLEFQTQLHSDAAPLSHLVRVMCQTGADIKFMRDPTRGGLAGVLADLVENTGLGIDIEETAVPLSSTARHTAELLGLDPLTVANEGCCVVVVPVANTDRILAACRTSKYGANAALIGSFTNAQPMANLITRAGGRRLIQRPYGEELPRIC